MRQTRDEFSRLRGQFGPIVPAEPNNAFLVSISVYTQLVPSFERLLARSDGKLSAFYTKVQELAATGQSSRDPLLARHP